MRIRISDATDTILDHEWPDDVRLAEFDKHKKTLLDMLRNEHKRGPKSEPFDGDKTWRSLTGLARFYLFRGRAKQETMPAADRIKRLRVVAKVLERAKDMTSEAMQSGNDLYSAWCEANAYFRHDTDDLKPPLTPVRIKEFDPVRTKDEFDKVFAGLASLETAARKATNDVRTKRGRPKGDAVLPLDFIWGLGTLYRDSTGSIPGAGEPFVQFVHEFLAAIGRPKKCTGDDTSPDYVVEAIKYARKQARKNPGRLAPSPFNE
jgi:hypothetical protein